MSALSTGRRRLAEHLIAKGMLPPDALLSQPKARGAGAPSPVAWKAGRRTIGGQTIAARSAWEANFARYLEFLRERGEIAAWRHEPIEFWFDAIKRGTRSYLPDFEVTESGGSILYYEVKGFFDRKSIVRLRRMRKYHPTVRIVLVGRRSKKSSAERSHQEVAADLGLGFITYADIAKFSALIEGWE